MKKLLLVCSIFTVVLFSCSKTKLTDSLTDKNTNSFNQTPQLQSIQTTFYIKHGIMFFLTNDALSAKIAELKKMNQDELNHYNLSQSGFTSLYRQYQLMDIDAENGNGVSASYAQEKGDIANIQDDYFASLVNKDGIIVVEDRIYHYLNNDEFEVADISALNDDGEIDFSNAEKFKVASSNWGNQQYASFSPQSHFFEQDGNNINWPKSNNRPVRMVHTKWCSWYGAYVSIGAKVKFEKKSTFAGWINISHDMAKMQPLKSNYRLWTIATGGYTYWNKSVNPITYGKNVNHDVLDYYVSVFPPVTGPLQHEVGTFRSNATAQRGGHTRTDDWIH